jgi:hypothetical protein
MSILKEPIDTIIFHFRYDETYEKLLSKLFELSIEIEKYDKIEGKIVIKFLASIFNMLIWKCWSDRLVFEIEEVHENKTKVSIFAIPNLFRFKIKYGEKLEDPKNLVSQLRMIGQTEQTGTVPRKSEN